MLCLIVFALILDVVVPVPFADDGFRHPEITSAVTPQAESKERNSQLYNNNNMGSTQNADLLRYEHQEDYFKDFLHNQPGFMSPVPTKLDILQPRSVNAESNLEVPVYNEQSNVPNEKQILSKLNQKREVINNEREPKIVDDFRRVELNYPANIAQAYTENHVTSDQRVRDILLSTKHEKRYLVLHPNGRVEHLDSLDDIEKLHPNYVLVNSRDIVPINKKEEVSIENVKSGNPVINSDTLLEQVPSALISQITEGLLNKPLDVIDKSKATEKSVTDKPTSEKPISTEKPIFITTCLPDVEFKNFGSHVTYIEEKPKQSTDTLNVRPDEEKVSIEELNDDSNKKPVTWFRTDDEDFWDKLSDSKDNYNVVYFFQAKPHHRVEKDTKRTIHPNGTIVEEFIECVWENENDTEPIVTKTVNIMHPEEEEE
ncbi:uncharacterized protein ACR2FA_002957 [Aphomia sociella]